MKLKNEIMLISGFSGSGKTSALRVFEEYGYYCVDNLPAIFLPEFLKHAQSQQKKTAIVVDARGSVFKGNLQKILANVRRSYKIRIIFLTCQLSTVTKRYHEARMSHPLLQLSIPQGYELEAKYLDEFRQRADLVLDSSQLNIHQLRREIKKQVFKKNDFRLEIVLLSFGYKNGLPLEADMIFDVRFLPNPFFEKTLKKSSGLSRKVAAYIFKQAESMQYFKSTLLYLTQLIKFYQNEERHKILLAFGCTGGFHRSVAMVNRLAKSLPKKVALSVVHRDLELSA